MNRCHLFRVCLIIVLMIPLAWLLLAALAGGSASGTLGSGRVVTVNSDSIYISCSYAKDTATINTSLKRIVIGPTNILIDGKEVATIDEAVKNVHAQVKRRAVTFLADGKPVETH
ncbi:MAG: hypothetical protein U0903_12910 [Planctomycetales bacterium]